MMRRRSVSTRQPLQHEPERVRLPGARLAAEKGVPVEPAGVERRGHARRKQELADQERRSRRPNRRQPLGHLGGLGRARERIVERLAVSVEDDALALARAKHHPRSQLVLTVAARQLGAVDSSQLERHDLAEPRVPRRSRARHSRRPATRDRAATPGARSACPSTDVASGRIDSSIWRRMARNSADC